MRFCVRTIVAALVLSVAGFGCRDWPDPEIVSVTPSQMVASDATQIDLRAKLPLAATVDYGDGSATVDTNATIHVGDLELGNGRAPKDGVFSLEVPTVFGPGRYDVRVTMKDGREATLKDGFTVTDGSWPDGYVIDPIEPQHPFIPFTITVRAQGANAGTFHGNVRIEAPTGATVGPTLSGAFVNGVLTQQVVMSSTRSDEFLIISDMAGHRVTSNTFALQ